MTPPGAFVATRDRALIESRLRPGLFMGAAAAAAGASGARDETPPGGRAP